MQNVFENLPHSPLPRTLDAFLQALGTPPTPPNRTMMDHIRLLAGTSNQGVVLMVGPSAPWIIPWVMDVLQPGTRAIALVEPGTEAAIQALGSLVQDDLRLALRGQDAPSFLADMGAQKFDLIIDLDQSAPLSDHLAQLFPFGSLVLGGDAPQNFDTRDAVAIHFLDDNGSFAGQIIKPRPATLKRRGGRRTRLEGREPGPKPDKSLFEGAFSET